MAFCVQCGETLSLTTEACPSCKRPVGLSSIGTALERQPGKSNVRALKLAAAVAALSIVAVLVVRFWPERALPSTSQMQAAATLAAPSLVKIAGSDGREAGAVVFRRVNDGLVLLAPATVAPSGRIVDVTSGGTTLNGFSLLSGGAPAIEQLAVVFVPDAGAFKVTEARLATSPALDQAMVALTSAGQPAGAGLVLSFEDGPEAGSLVHDLPLTVAERGYGFWAPDGQLFALATFAPAKGESLALAASALSARLLIHELAVLDDGSFSEHALPLAKGTRLGLAVRASGLDVRVGNTPARRGRQASEGWRTFDTAVTGSGPLQISAKRPKGPAVAVTLAPF